MTNNIQGNPHKVESWFLSSLKGEDRIEKENEYPTLSDKDRLTNYETI